MLKSAIPTRLDCQGTDGRNALIQEFVECKQFGEALKLYHIMQKGNTYLTKHSLQALLKACARERCLETGRVVHIEMVKRNHKVSLIVASMLVDMYAKNGALEEARGLLDSMASRDVVLWNALISGYVEHGLALEALICLESMWSEGVFPTAVTFVCTFKACGILGAINKGWLLHVDAVKEGFETSLFVGNALLDMYAKCNSMSEAQDVFDEMPIRDVVSWTTRITGYMENGLCKTALSCFEEMHQENISPNAVTFLCILKICGSMGSIDIGQHIYVDIVKKGFELDTPIGNTLVDLYASAGFLTEAQDVFNNLSSRNHVTWNVLIAGYAEQGLGCEAWHCFVKMKQAGLPPDVVTFLWCSKACGDGGSISRGRQLHGEIAEEGLEQDPLVGSALVDMYAKCGAFAEVQDLFLELQVRDVVAWTAVISGAACHGETELALELFESMTQQTVQPNDVTCLSILTACSHAGNVRNGQQFYECFTKEYNTTPSIEHYNGMVDLLSRAGQLHESVAMLEELPFTPDVMTCYSILAACHRSHDIQLARLAIQTSFGSTKEHGALFTLLANMYADS